MLVWYIPVIIAERLAEQTGAVTYAFSNTTPSRAKRSTWGVPTRFSPW